jgi:thiamine biosynthesis lipoprotein
VEVSEPLSYVLGEGLRVSKQSGGAFDVTIGPLVNAWGFGPDGRVTPPTQEAVQALKAHMGYQKLSLIEGGRRAVKQDPELYIDLSGIAKGYGVDQAADYLKRAGYTRYWVEVGGEVRASGLNAEDSLWRAGIERPAGEGRRAVYMVLPLKDTSIATSGDYRNRYVDPQGVLRSHTIDPRTGSPITHQLASVSVVAERNINADAWATALNVLGPEEGLKVANSQKLAALFLVRPEGATQGDLNSPLTPVLSEAMKRYLQEVGAQLPE